MRLLRLCLLILALRLFLSDPIIVYDSFVVSLKGELSRKRNISTCNRIPRTACWGSLNLTGQYVTPKLQKSQAESVFRTKKIHKSYLFASSSSGIVRNDTRGYCKRHDGVSECRQHAVFPTSAPQPVPTALPVRGRYGTRSPVLDVAFRGADANHRY